MTEKNDRPVPLLGYVQGNAICFDVVLRKKEAISTSETAVHDTPPAHTLRIGIRQLRLIVLKRIAGHMDNVSPRILRRGRGL